MNNLVVFAHPNPNSFGKGIVDAIVIASEEKGDNVRVRDLYKIEFNPILKSEDFEAFKMDYLKEVSKIVKEILE